jgi:carbonic anhydrase
MSELGPTIRIAEADSAETLDQARCLLRSYAREYAGSIAETLCFQGFEKEVAGLPGRYGPPSGCILLATEEHRPAGCVAMRDLGGGTCEMKRLYVAPEFRRRGLGRSLVEEILGRAARNGYARMVLDTVPEMVEAIALYRSFGFVDTEPYWPSPVEKTVYLARDLASR